MLYLFLQTIPAALLGALVSGSPTALYPTYAMAPRIVAMTPLFDQQLGGLIMWVGGGFYYLMACAVVFFVWANREEASNRRPGGNSAPHGQDGGAAVRAA